MAAREIRASWQRLLFFFVCIAVGVASIVAIRSVIQSVREGLTREARAMTGADVVVRSDRPLGDKVRSSVEQARESGRVGTVSEAIEIATMVRPPNATMTRMVELRAVQQAFPLYGTMTLREGQYSHALLQNHGPWCGRAAGAAQSARWRRRADRHTALSDSRRDRQGAGTQPRRVLLGLAPVHRSG
jgi:putative ABC transport system permease protein